MGVLCRGYICVSTPDLCIQPVASRNSLWAYGRPVFPSARKPETASYAGPVEANQWLRQSARSPAMCCERSLYSFDIPLVPGL